MAIRDYLYFQNPGVAIIVISLLMFILVYAIVQRFIKKKGSSIVIALVLSLTAGWYLYREGLYQSETLLSFLFALVVIVVVLRIVWGFLKSFRKRF